MTYPEFSDATTLGEARAWMREQAATQGARCPCCTQYAKVYKRLMTPNIARLLVRAYREHGQTWFHATSLRDGTGDLAKLRYWRLLEESTERRADSGRAGWWRITDAGVAFIRTGATVPKYALIYDSYLLGHDGDQVGIRDALGERFDLAELMAEGAGVAPDLHPEGVQP